MRHSRWTGWISLWLLTLAGHAAAEERPPFVDAEACLPAPEEIAAGFRAPWQEKGLTRAAWVETGEVFLISPLTTVARELQAAIEMQGPAQADVPWTGLAPVVDLATAMVGLPALPAFGTHPATPAPAPAPKVAVATVLASLRELADADSDCVGATYVRTAKRDDLYVQDLDEVSVVVTVLAPAWSATHAADLDLDDAELGILAGYAFDMWTATVAGGREDLKTFRERQKHVNQELTDLEQRLRSATSDAQKAGLMEAIQQAQRRLKDVQEAMRSVAGRTFAVHRERVAAEGLDAGSLLWSLLHQPPAPPLVTITARVRVGRLFVSVRRTASGAFATPEAAESTKALLLRLAKERLQPALRSR